MLGEGDALLGGEERRSTSRARTRAWLRGWVGAVAGAVIVVTVMTAACEPCRRKLFDAKQHSPSTNRTAHAVRSRFPLGFISPAARRARRETMEPLMAEHAPPPGQRSWELFAPQTLPKAWDWRTSAGANVLSQSNQQHWDVISACGSCWAFASVQALSDRISIARNGSFPSVTLAQQVLLNCQDCGDCEDGGDAHCVMGYVHKYGLPDNTCQPYLCRTGRECTPNGKVGYKHCLPECQCFNPAPVGDTRYAITVFRKWYVKHHGAIPRGDVHAMKAEIYAHGPVVCALYASDRLQYTYAGGVYSEPGDYDLPSFNHQVAVSGWGVDEAGREHWIVRNSWGTFWGEEGWFRIQIGSDNLGIEKYCTYGTIDLERSAPTPPTPLSRYYMPPGLQDPAHP